MSSQPARLLIVDDNDINRQLLSRMLAKRGYAISLAEGAQGLLERVRRDAVDLVLLVRYWRLRNCCRLSVALAIDRAKLSFATLWANTLLITSSSAEVKDS